MAAAHNNDGVIDECDIGLTAECLLAHSMNKSRSYLFAFAEVEPSQNEQATFSGYVSDAVKGRPVAYITGSKEFWSLDFHVNQDTLIPRPDSETLIDAVLNYYADDMKSPRCVIDLGTGSGALAIAVKSECAHWRCFAVDHSFAAVLTAKRNSQRLQHEVGFIQSDWLMAIASNRLDVVMSNPPYIDKNDEHLAALRYEPMGALVAEKGGYSDLISIIQQSLRCLKMNGTLWLEHGYHQAVRVRQLLIESGFSDVCSHKDLAGIERISFGRLVSKQKVNTL